MATQTGFSNVADARPHFSSPEYNSEPKSTVITVQPQSQSTTQGADLPTRKVVRVQGCIAIVVAVLSMLMLLPTAVCGGPAIYLGVKGLKLYETEPQKSVRYVKLANWLAATAILTVSTTVIIVSTVFES